jgi:hypothetical protein
MKFSVKAMSILKGWSYRAVNAIVRLKALAPYAMIELILPGGSVMALLLWFYRRRRNRGHLVLLPGGLLATLRTRFSGRSLFGVTINGQ